jgi:hypothetical protein
MKYIEENELQYQVILSKGKGNPTKELGKMLIKIADNVFLKLKYSYKDEEFSKDIHSEGFLKLYENWHNINLKKYDKALPYYTEIFKRAAMKMFNDFYRPKPRYKDINVKFTRLNEIYNI